MYSTLGIVFQHWKQKKKKEKIKTANYNKLQYIRETKASQHFSIVELNYDKIEIGMEKKKKKQARRLNLKNNSRECTTYIKSLKISRTYSNISNSIFFQTQILLLFSPFLFQYHFNRSKDRQKR